jgi:hypothetical protein
VKDSAIYQMGGSLRSSGQYKILRLHGVVAYRERVHIGVNVLSGNIQFETNCGTKLIQVDGRLQSRVSQLASDLAQKCLGFPTSP